MDDPSRKAFLTTAAGALGAAAVAPQAASAATGSTTTAARRERAYRLRRDAAEAYLHDPIAAVHDNGDETRYADRRASFSKTLPHDELGHVDPAAYRAFLAAVASGAPEAFEAIPRDPAGTARLNDPQATYSFELAGLDSYATHLAPPPAFASAQAAAEMVELYWLSLTLDVPFRAYAGDPLVSRRAGRPARLQRAAARRRGAVRRGDRVPRRDARRRGRAVRQPVPRRRRAVRPDDDRAALPRAAARAALRRDVRRVAGLPARRRAGVKTRFAAQRRYLATARDLSEYIHSDFSYQPYLNAALIALAYGSEALSPTNPYRRSKRQFGDITLGNKDVLTLVAQAALLAQKGSWYHKWQVHRRLRPEAFSGRVDNQLAGRYRYDVHADLLARRRPGAHARRAAAARSSPRHIPKAARRTRRIRPRTPPMPGRAARCSRRSSIPTS